MDALDALPGYRRSISIAPAPTRVEINLEDDFHHMRVALTHADDVVTDIDAEMIRAPWTTCPGAETRLKQTFTGQHLESFRHRGERTTNCTHLHDMALLGAAHAHDSALTRFDILVSDPVDGQIHAELRRNGEQKLHWIINGFVLATPADAAGIGLMRLSPYIASLSGENQEEARLLRWGAIIAHGRAIPLDQQSNAEAMPANCFTFQPETAKRAVRVGEIRDFTASGEPPLAPRITAPTR